MRIDLFINKTGILKRRSIAKELCDRGLVELNDRQAKASHEIKPGDQLSIKLPDKCCRYLVRDIPLGNVKKEDRFRYAELVSEEHFHTA